MYHPELHDSEKLYLAVVPDSIVEVVTWTYLTIVRVSQAIFDVINNNIVPPAGQ